MALPYDLRTKDGELVMISSNRRRNKIVNFEKAVDVVDGFRLTRQQLEIIRNMMEGGNVDR